MYSCWVKVRLDGLKIISGFRMEVVIINCMLSTSYNGSHGSNCVYAMTHACHSSTCSYQRDLEFNVPLGLIPDQLLRLVNIDSVIDKCLLISQCYNLSVLAVICVPMAIELEIIPTCLLEQYS